MENQDKPTLADLLSLGSVSSSLVLETLRNHAKEGKPIKPNEVLTVIDMAGMDNYDLIEASRHLGIGYRASHGQEHSVDYLRAMNEVASRLRCAEF
ncbi:MAG TPA: hypothetical protein VJC07_02595 [Candidatus Nanoarchaeia archaeon]|nr:hypothetical protein [Candidatus Nanoarchaeia archaeon]